VLPSWYREGLPRTILEAMSVGRGVITTDMPGCREPIDQGINGFVVEPRSAKALADAMLRICNDPTLPASLAQAARRTAEQYYSVEKVNALLLSTMKMDRNATDRAERPAMNAQLVAGEL
jgi:glycosyltransferase involved in cell wall biosynthesis